MFFSGFHHFVATGKVTFIFPVAAVKICPLVLGFQQLAGVYLCVAQLSVVTLPDSRIPNTHMVSTFHHVFTF